MARLEPIFVVPRVKSEPTLFSLFLIPLLVYSVGPKICNFSKDIRTPTGVHFNISTITGVLTSAEPENWREYQKDPSS